ncbi:MAG: hypothetical protein ACK481_08205 [Candidatus Melainabacteria bacterium]|jgi:hypothetical protein
MGHVRLGRLPKSKTWEGVIGCLDLPESSLKDIVQITFREIQKVLIDSTVIESLSNCFDVYANIAQASRGKSFVEDLNSFGLEIDSKKSGLKLLDSIVHLAEDTKKISILDQIATDSFRETMLTVIEQDSSSLFGCTINSVQKAFKKFSTPNQIGKLGHEYFSTYIYKSFSYVIDKELANSIREEGRFRHSEDIKEFHQGVTKYCFELGKYVEQYSADWYSKHLFANDLNNPQKVRNFTNYAISKLLLELSLGEVKQ